MVRYYWKEKQSLIWTLLGFGYWRENTKQVSVDFIVVPKWETLFVNKPRQVKLPAFFSHFHFSESRKKRINSHPRQNLISTVNRNFARKFAKKRRVFIALTPLPNRISILIIFRVSSHLAISIYKVYSFREFESLIKGLFSLSLISSSATQNVWHFSPVEWIPPFAFSIVHRHSNCCSLIRDLHRIKT